MWKSISLALAGIALIGTVASAEARQPPQTSQERLDKMIEGRTAGEPTDCIYLRDIGSSAIIDRTAIVYRMNNGMIYVNVPDSGAAFLNSSAVMVTDTHSSQLCNVDVVRLVDSTSRMDTGSVGLGKFVPYPRPERAQN